MMKKFSVLLSKKYFFIAASIVALVAYSFVVYAAAPTGGYLPSDHQLDPSCAPGDTDCFVTLPSAVIDGVVQGGTAGSVLFVDGAGHLSEDNSRFFYDASNHRLGLGTTSPTALLHVVAGSVPGSVGSTTYSGAGLDDATFDGAYTGTQSGCSILLGVASLGTGGSGNDEFIYGYSDNACGSGSNTPIEITPGVAQDLGNGITVTFTNGTGHTAIIMSPLNNYWMASLQPPVAGPAPLLLQDEDSNTLFKVSTTGKVTIGGVEYTFPGSAPASNGYVLSSTTSGVLSWVSAAGGSSLPSQSGNAGKYLKTDGTTASWADPTLFVDSNYNVLTKGIGAGAALDPSAQANVLIGRDAGGYYMTTGSWNTFVGYQAGYAATGNANIFIGGNAGGHSDGSYNVVVGNGTESYGLGNGNTQLGQGTTDGATTVRDGNYNTILGYNAGILNNDGDYAIALGYGARANPGEFALSDMVTKWKFRGNSYVLPSSDSAGYLTSDGSGNLSWEGSLLGETGTNNVWLGRLAGSGGASYTQTVFIGESAGSGALTASDGVFIGHNSGLDAVNSFSSVFVGGGAGLNATDAPASVAIGAGAAQNATNAKFSVFIGYGAGADAPNAMRSIMIGLNAGQNDTVDNLTAHPVGRSILIGDSTSTGGYSNSIALGAYAVNTAENQFLVGSSLVPVKEFVIVGQGSTSCAIDANGTACSSDQRLKTNITDLNSNVLDSLLKIKTVTFNWMSGVDQDRHIGFIAQDMQQYFPELVSTGSNGYLQVNYAGMTPVIVEAIRELNLKIANITTIADAQNQTLLDKIRTWLADTANGIEKITSREIDVKQLCVSNDAGDKTCLTKEQVDHLLGSTPAPQNPAPAPQNPDPVPTQDDPNTDTPQDNVPVDTTVDSGGDEVPPVDIGDVTPPDENPPEETPTPDQVPTPDPAPEVPAA